MTIVSITLPGDLLNQFDEFIKTRGYFSRSEAFRDAVRSIIAESETVRLDSEVVHATLMITCDYERKEVDMRVGEIRHEFDDIVVENIHKHIAKRYCLEIFIVEGEPKRIMELVGRVRGMRGIRQVKAMFMPI